MSGGRPKSSFWAEGKFVLQHDEKTKRPVAYCTVCSNTYFKKHS